MAAPKGHPRYGGGRRKGQKSKQTIARERGRSRALRAAEITAERTMLELGRIAFTDRRRVWADEQLKPLEKWTADEAACLEGFEVIVKNAAAGDNHTDTVHKVKLATKQHALEVLAKHFGLLTTKVEVSGTLTLEDLVAGSLAAEE